ncbi:MAG: beta propeller repeat protein [Acidimicrobiales bacterium]
MRSLRTSLGAISALALLALASPAESATSAIPVLLAPVPNSHFAYVIESASSGCGHTFCLWFSRISDPPAPASDRHLPPLHALEGQPAGNLESLQFTSPEDGYLWAKEGRVSALYVTTDGAHLWHRTVATSSLLPAHPFTATHGHLYFVTGTCSGMGICRDFRLHSAGASGATWTSRPLALSPDTSGVGLGAIGSELWIEEGLSTGVRVLFSRNEGRSFTQWTTNIYGAPTGCMMTASTPSNIWAECPTGMNFLYEVSVDGGHHWRAINTGGLIPSTAGGAFDPLNAYVAFVDVGADATLHGADLLRTSPDGTTVKVGRLGCSILFGLDFVDATHGLADCQQTPRATSTVLLMTSDGGRIWIPFH